MGCRERGCNGHVGRNADNAGIIREEQRLLVGGAVHFDLAVQLALETLDDDEIGRRHFFEQLRQSRLGGAAQFVHQRPAPGRGDQHLGGAGLAMHPGVLARHVDIELVMGVLDHGDAQAFFEQMRDDALQERGLAGAAPSCEPDHLHLILRQPRRNRG